MKNKKIVAAAGVIVAAVAIFFGGVYYGKSTVSNCPGSGNFEQRQFIMNNQKTGGNAIGGAVSGEVIEMDDRRVTVKTADGGSKIVFVSTSTIVTKNAEGNMDDLKIGERVSIIGSSGSDGSVSASSIQIQPERAFPGRQR